MRQSELRHVAEPLGNRIYAFPKSRPRQSAGERRSAISKQQDKAGTVPLGATVHPILAHAK